MTWAAAITAARYGHTAAVWLSKDHSNILCRAVDKRISCSHAFVSRCTCLFQQFDNVDDQPRLGRSPTAVEETQHNVLEAVQLPECRVAVVLAVTTKQGFSKQFSHNTVNSIVQGNAFTHALTGLKSF